MLEAAGGGTICILTNTMYAFVANEEHVVSRGEEGVEMVENEAYALSRAVRGINNALEACETVEPIYEYIH